MTTYLNENFVNSHPTWGDYMCALWLNNNGVWVLTNTYDDPYDAIEPMVTLENPSVLEMFGKATNMETGEASRVRVLFSFDGENPSCSIQIYGDDELITDEDTAGMFMDYFHMVRMALA